MSEQYDLMTGAEAALYDQLPAASHSRFERLMVYPVLAFAGMVGVVPGGGIVSPRAEATTVVEFDYDDTEPGSVPTQRQPWVPKPNQQFGQHGRTVRQIAR